MPANIILCPVCGCNPNDYDDLWDDSCDGCETILANNTKGTEEQKKVNVCFVSETMYAERLEIIEDSIMIYTGIDYNEHTEYLSIITAFNVGRDYITNHAIFLKNLDTIQGDELCMRSIIDIGERGELYKLQESFENDTYILQDIEDREAENAEQNSVYRAVEKEAQQLLGYDTSKTRGPLIEAGYSYIIREACQYANGKDSQTFMGYNSFAAVKSNLLIGWANNGHNSAAHHENICWLKPYRMVVDIDFKRESYTNYAYNQAVCSQADKVLFTYDPITGEPNYSLYHKIMKSCRSASDAKDRNDRIDGAYIQQYMVAFAITLDKMSLNLKPSQCMPMVLVSSRHDKLSLHMLSQHDVIFTCKQQAIDFIQMMRAHLLGCSPGLANGIDECLYKSDTCMLRLPFCTKYHGATDTMLLPYKKCPLSYNEANRSDVFKWFVQTDNTPWSAYPTILAGSKPMVNVDVDDVMAKAIIDAIHSDYPEYMYTHIDNLGNHSFKRLKQTHCAIGDRVHTSQGSYLAGYRLICWACSKQLKSYKYILEGGIDNKTPGSKTVLSDKIYTISKTYQPCMFDSVTCAHEPVKVQYILDIPGILENNGDVYIRSSYGTGKTRYMQELIARARAEGKSVLIIGSRKSYNEKIKCDIGCVSYTDITGKLYDNRNVVQIWQIEALTRVMTCEPFDIIICDEINSICNHIYSDDNMSSKKSAAIRQLNYLLYDAKRVIVLDNDLTQVHINAIQKTRALGSHNKARGDDVRSSIYVNSFNRWGADVKCDILYGKHARPVNMNRLIDRLNEQHALLENGQPYKGTVVTVHNKTTLNFIVGELNKRYGATFCKNHIVSYHGDSGDHIKNSDFADVNKAWSGKLAVLYTQTVSVGISFDGDHFDHCYGFFEYNLKINMLTTMQSVFRCRQLKFISLYIVAAPITDRYNTPLKIFKALLDNTDARRHYSDDKFHISPRIRQLLELKRDDLFINQNSITQLEKDILLLDDLQKMFNNEMSANLWLSNAYNTGQTHASPIIHADKLLKQNGIIPTMYICNSIDIDKKDYTVVKQNYIKPVSPAVSKVQSTADDDEDPWIACEGSDDEEDDGYKFVYGQNDDDEEDDDTDCKNGTGDTANDADCKNGMCDTANDADCKNGMCDTANDTGVTIMHYTNKSICAGIREADSAYIKDVVGCIQSVNIANIAMSAKDRIDNQIPVLLPNLEDKLAAIHRIKRADNIVDPNAHPDDVNDAAAYIERSRKYMPLEKTAEALVEVSHITGKDIRLIKKRDINVEKWRDIRHTYHDVLNRLDGGTDYYDEMAHNESPQNTLYERISIIIDVLKRLGITREQIDKQAGDIIIPVEAFKTDEMLNIGEMVIRRSEAVFGDRSSKRWKAPDVRNTNTIGKIYNILFGAFGAKLDGKRGRVDGKSVTKHYLLEWVYIRPPTNTKQQPIRNMRTDDEMDSSDDEDDGPLF